MWAESLAKRANDRIDTIGIAPKTLAEIRDFFEKNPKMIGGTQVVALRGTLENFQKNHKNDASFKEKYGVFYDWYNKREANFQASPEGKAQRQATKEALTNPGKDGRSIAQKLAE